MNLIKPCLFCGGQAEFLEIMKSLGYEFDENSEKEGVEIQLENDSYCISANEIKK